MIENYIRNLDANTLKAFLKKQNIEATNDELYYVLNILKTRTSELMDPSKRQAIINGLPMNIKQKVLILLNRFSL